MISETNQCYPILIENYESACDEYSLGELRCSSNSKLQPKALGQDFDNHCQVITDDLANYDLPIILSKSSSMELFSSSSSTCSEQKPCKDVYTVKRESESLQMTSETYQCYSISIEDCESRSDEYSQDMLRFASESKVQLEALGRDLDKHCQVITDDLANYDLPIIVGKCSSLEVQSDIMTTTSDMGNKANHIDCLMIEVNDLCQKIEDRIDNIVHDTEG